MFRQHAKPEKSDLAVDMRMNPTPAEAAIAPYIWRMREPKHKIKFRTQQVILGWIVDFYCPTRRLVVEIDGSSHDRRKQQDAVRDEAMRSICKIQTLRFTNEEVLADARGVAVRIWRVARSRPIFRSSSVKGMKRYVGPN